MPRARIFLALASFIAHFPTFRPEPHLLLVLLPSISQQSILNHVKMEVHDAIAAQTAAKDQVGIAQAGMRSASKELELAWERYAVITASSHFEVTNALTAVARARENLVEALFQLNAARVNLARATRSLNSLP